MSFDPIEFATIARALLDTDMSQAAKRAAVSRCYYAVYGALRISIAGAKGTSDEQLFGRAGRHSDLRQALVLGGRRTHALSQLYGSLLARRVRADYQYASASNISDSDALAAIDEAEDAVLLLRGLRATDLSTLPFVPPNS